MIFKQLFEKESSTYSYLLADAKTREGVIIDPVVETLDRDRKLIQELGIQLKYILETHIHADHVTSASQLRKETQAKILLSKDSKLKAADRLLADGELIRFGRHEIKTILTPGHTDSCASYYVEGRVFTGDVLLIRGCGRTDFQQGSNQKLFHSVREKLFKLPDGTIVFPAHNYVGICSSSIDEEKKHNPRLKLDVSFNEFENIMNNLNLPKPQKIELALPLNLNCGESQ